MPRVKMILLSLLAMVMLGAVFSAAASAATHNYKVEGKNIASEKVEIQEVSTNGALESTITGLKVLISCRETIGPPEINTLEKEGKSKWEDKTITGCLIWEIKEGKKSVITACKIHEPIIAKGESLLIGAAGSGEAEYKEESSKPLTTLELEGGSCALAKKIEVKGSSPCATIESGVETVAHNITCTGVGSKVKLGTEPAYDSGTALITTKKLEKWSLE